MEILLEKLLSASKILDLIWDIASEGMVITDSKGIILKANPSFCKIFELEKDPTGNNISFIYPTDIQYETEKQYQQLFNAALYPRVLEKTFQLNNGTEKVIETKISFLEVDSKRLAMLQVMKYESELKLTERKYLKAKEKAEESDRLKTAFLSNLSHEIRTPMNGIIGFAGMLIDPDLPMDKRNQFIEIINSSSNQLLNLIDDIIDLSKIEAGQIEINNKEFCINNFLTEIFKYYLPHANSKGLNLIYQPNPLLPDNLNIYTDEIKLKQILSNLLNNALKFTHEGFIEFGAALKGNELEFYVKDTGIGVDKKLHNKIFERFTQADNTTTRRYGGTGLGLPISKSYVELLGGKIWIESSQNNGSILYFTIPYRTVIAPKRTDTILPKMELPDWSSKTIIIAEDEETNFFYISEVFAGSGVHIVRAKTGFEAIEIVRNNPKIDLILMDIKMPELNGYEATKIVKQLNPSIPIIAQTAYALAGDRDTALEAGCDDYISKPVKKDKLLSIVSKFLTS
jgi:PAS domain S-box-containing protein